ncbi:ACT domain-containing protein [Bacillus sp. FJAT-49711]|uniref:ACT domain-containing protein n=1 Tax=Bacillus sp. FJAT-49711 TaxID=2833585 RepID=UPI001BC9E36A|nr:ACT domain-containing protein [Bacillus sp. FJAT-49711]MBS4217020.1 ACT domain-containing protein [Bacillus sp. FJAT-49711]
MGKKEYDQKFYLVREDVLPEAMKKTLEAKELIERGKSDSVWDAVQQVDLSRSAFYKYRDTVFPFHLVVKEKIISLFFFLEDKPGALSKLLGTVATNSCNVLTIHQTIPLQGRANVTLSLDITNMSGDIDELLVKLRRLEFVDKVDVLSSGG